MSNKNSNELGTSDKPEEHRVSGLRRLLFVVLVCTTTILMFEYADEVWPKDGVVDATITTIDEDGNARTESQN